ncbi:MAG TPA: GWxTD domain-containing protein [Thermoanaerobaculaceae bacterium]|mgnify:CR=1 FL=1|nr:GWxTD domain-containing protein [Thermoanaerobaculaceae bacterium]HPS80097.1 GWxTD domain-containing protein [Thermoanaerobaculaceae bacterium]
MRRTIVPLALLVLAMAVPAGAQLSQKYADWPNSAVGFLMTDDEKAEFSRLTTDAQAEAFIEIFWARRDPNQKTSFNEFKAEFDAKVAGSDKQFSWTKGTGEPMPGSLSDRGKVLILMGVPSKPVENFPPQANDSLPESMQRGSSQVWSFLKAGSKPGSQNKDDYIAFTFVESRVDAKDYLFDKMDRKYKASQKILAERPKQFVVNKINSVAEIPRLLIDGIPAASPEHLAMLDAEPKPWPTGAATFIVAGVQSETLHPIWLHLELPDAVSVVDQAIGRVTGKSDGKLVGTFQTPVTAISLAGGRGYDLSLPVEVGEYKVDVGLLAAGTPVAVRSLDAVSDPSSPEGVYISAMYTGAEPRQETTFKLGDPFNIGGWRIIPRPSGAYRPTEQLAYFAYVIKPGLAEGGQPKIAFGMKLTVEGKDAGKRAPMPVQISKIGENIYMFGQNLPLSAFSKPGEYVLELTLVDQITKVERTTVVKLNMVNDAAAPAAK